VPTQFITGTTGVEFAYRRLNAGTGVPVVFFNRFRGNLDDWDPLVVDGLAASREIVLFDNAGVGRSSGMFPDTIDEAAEHAVALIEALALPPVDLLGFSMGSYVAQCVASLRPDLVRRVGLTGSGSRSRAGSWPQEVTDAALHDPLRPKDTVFLFFTSSADSSAAGWKYHERLTQRDGGHDLVVTAEAWRAQLRAMSNWAQDTDRVWQMLTELQMPVFVANGNEDIMVGSDNSFDLGQRIPFAQTVIYPDSGHGFLFQYPDWFVRQFTEFLDTDFGS
jgi:pimeloyl-ACP methyl ester carboxylesterase